MTTTCGTLILLEQWYHGSSNERSTMLHKTNEPLPQGWTPAMYDSKEAGERALKKAVYRNGKSYYNTAYIDTFPEAASIDYSYNAKYDRKEIIALNKAYRANFTIKPITITYTV